MKSSISLPTEGAVVRPLILIVDDDRAVRDSLAEVIEAFGYRTRTAGNGFEGLQAVETETPSAIITDLHMPEMDGFALLTALHSTWAGIPVIAISGGASKDYDFLDAAKQIGAVATFHKPLPVLEMIDVINGLTTRAAA